MLHKYNIFLSAYLLLYKKYQKKNLEFSASYYINNMMCCKQDVLLY